MIMELQFCSTEPSEPSSTASSVGGNLTIHVCNFRVFFTGRSCLNREAERLAIFVTSIFFRHDDPVLKTCTYTSEYV